MKVWHPLEEHIIDSDIWTRMNTSDNLLDSIVSKVAEYGFVLGNYVGGVGDEGSGIGWKGA